MNTNTFRCAAAGVLLALASGAMAGELRSLSEDEMSGVYGRGPSEGALGAQEQGNAYAAGGDPQAAMALLTAEGAKNLERQLSQQQLAAGTTGLQATIRSAQSLAAATQVLAPLAITIPVMPFMFLPALTALPNGGKKN